MGKEEGRIAVGNLRLDKGRFEVILEGFQVELTAKEFGILWILACEAGKVFHREELVREVWGSGISVGPRTVDAHIKTLRKKFCGVAGSPSCIETVRGVGYRFRSKPERRV
jgi:two-component system alkaline phosphatase synthesis response regulator PhoP